MVRSGKAGLRPKGMGILVFEIMTESIRNLTSKLNRTTFAALQRRTHDGPDRRREP